MKSSDFFSVLKAKGVDVSFLPGGGAASPGFYYNAASDQVEHYSLPAEWNANVGPVNANGLVLDGFQGVSWASGIDELYSLLINWKAYLDKQSEGNA